MKFAKVTEETGISMCSPFFAASGFCEIRAKPTSKSRELRQKIDFFKYFNFIKFIIIIYIWIQHKTEDPNVKQMAYTACGLKEQFIRYRTFNLLFLPALPVVVKYDPYSSFISCYLPNRIENFPRKFFSAQNVSIRREERSVNIFQMRVLLQLL